VNEIKHDKHDKLNAKKQRHVVWINGMQINISKFEQKIKFKTNLFANSIIVNITLAAKCVTILIITILSFF